MQTKSQAGEHRSVPLEITNTNTDCEGRPFGKGRNREWALREDSPGFQAACDGPCRDTLSRLGSGDGSPCRSRVMTDGRTHTHKHSTSLWKTYECATPSQRFVRDSFVKSVYVLYLSKL